MKNFPRILDIVAAGLGLIFLSPLFFIIAVVIKATSAGPVFFRSARIGRNAQMFRIYKFRSMRNDADRSGSGITKDNDPRITPIGHWLRRTKIDELPQLINVFLGEMSLVGPRPEDPRFVIYYPDELRCILSLKPGMTSAASLRFRNESALLTGDNHEEEYSEKILPAKLRIDFEYFKEAGLGRHLVLILKTVISVGKRE